MACSSFDNRLATSFHLCRPSARATITIQSEGRNCPHHHHYHHPHPNGPTSILAQRHDQVSSGLELHPEIWTFRISAGGEKRSTHRLETQCVWITRSVPGEDIFAGTQLLSLSFIRIVWMHIDPDVFSLLCLNRRRQVWNLWPPGLKKQQRCFQLT